MILIKRKFPGARKLRERTFLMPKIGSGICVRSILIVCTSRNSLNGNTKRQFVVTLSIVRYIKRIVLRFSNFVLASSVVLITMHSRPQRPRSFWSAPRITTSGPLQRHSGFEWLCKHNRLRPEPIRFARLDSEHAQSDGKSVNRGLPVLDLARGPQRSNECACLSRARARGNGLHHFHRNKQRQNGRRFISRG